MEKRHVLVHGQDIALFQEGEGPALLLIHGLASSAETWSAVIPGLAKRFTVIAPDLPGHGDSTKARGDHSLGGYATCLRDLLLLLGHEEVTLVGHSFGGGVAMQFAHQFPGMCERLVLVSSGGLGPEVGPWLRLLSFPGSGWLLALGCQPLLDRAGRWVGRRLRGLGVRSTPVIEEVARTYAALAHAPTRRSFLQALRSVIDTEGQSVTATHLLHLVGDLPVLLIWGARDPVIPVAHAIATHERIEQSRLEIFKGAGHLPQCESPQRFVDVLSAFIEATAVPPVTEKSGPRLAVVAR